jgi:N-acetylmuramoyl-L-alanine amidase
MSGGKKTYEVKAGECISSIAYKFGFLWWKTIWDDAANAALREKRPDPHILLEGDKLTIPEKEVREESCATGQRHRFGLSGVPCVLRLVVMDCNKPCRNQPYTLSVDGLELHGTTDSEGKLHQPIPPDATHAMLFVGPDDERMEYEINLGTLDPVTTVTGVQARLANLGYKVGPIDGKIGEKTWHAISAFCYEQEIDHPPHGTINDTFLDKLQEVHGF